MSRPYPVAREHPLHPPSAYARWRAEAPAVPITLPGGDPAWLVTRHDDVRRLLRDPRLSSDSTRPGYPRFGAAVETPPLNATFIGLDDPEHARQRRMIAAEFSTAAVKRLRPEIDRIADQSAEELRARPAPADFVTGYALPVSSRVICHVLGVPYAAHEEFESLTHVLTDGERTPAEKQDAGARIVAMLSALARSRAVAPRDDLISRLMAGPVSSGELTGRAAVFTIALLLGAGHDTSAAMLSLGALSLLEDEEQRSRLAAGGTLGRGAVEELLRFHSIVQLGIARVATADIDLAGQRIAAGDGVVLSVQGANRDGERFGCPDRLDWARPNAHQHVAFGFGPHQCVGHLLARVTLESALTRVFHRLPGLRLAVEPEALRFKESMDFHGVHEMPVLW